MFRQSDVRLPKKVQLLCDSAYIGIGKEHVMAKLPYKRSKLKDLTKQQQLHNRRLARKRVAIEHVFAQMKVFQILAQKYRSKLERYAQHVRIIAAIINAENPR